MRRIRSRVPGECSERPCASGTRPGTQRKNREAQYVLLRLVVSPWTPGLATLARGTSVRSRGARSEPLAGVVTHDVKQPLNSHSKQRSLLRSRGALLRPGSSSMFASAPNEGRAERRQAHYFCCRAGEARPIRTRRGAARPMTRDARLSALHRGDFRPGAALPSPALRAPRSQVIMPGGRCPGQPLQRSESSGDDRERPPMLFRNNDLVVYYRADKRRCVSVAIPVLKPGVVPLGLICSSRRNGWLCLQSARGVTTTGMA
jgi:hypothetical protein